jgi:hypothetical protein
LIKTLTSTQHTYRFISWAGPGGGGGGEEREWRVVQSLHCVCECVGKCNQP